MDCLVHYAWNYVLILVTAKIVKRYVTAILKPVITRKGVWVCSF